MWKHRKKLMLCLMVLILPCWLIGSADGKIDICESMCKCNKETRFKKIHCDFSDNKEYKLDDEVILPSSGNAINITLGDLSKLFIHHGFFANNNHINSVLVSGSNEDFKMTHNHVEVTELAFAGVFGGYPEIGFRNLKKVILNKQSLDGLGEINLVVESVWQLVAHREVFGKTTFNATFSDVSDLILHEGVLETSLFNMPKPKLFINRSFIRELKSLRGRELVELRIENSEIGTIKSLALSALSIDSFVLDNVKIERVESNIFREASLVTNVAVINCNIQKMDSKAIHDIGITNFSFERNLINTISGNALNFVGGTVTIAHNSISLMAPKWISVRQWSNISVVNNTFGNFDAMELDSPVDGAHCSFRHNSFTIVQPESFKSIKCKFSELIFMQACTCNFNSTWLFKLFNQQADPPLNFQSIQSQSFCGLPSSDPLQNCFKAEAVRFDQYFKEICSKNSRRKSKLKCDNVKVDKIDANFVDPKTLFDDFDWMDYINYIIAGSVIFLITCVAFTFVWKRATAQNSTRDRSRQNDLMHLNQSEGPPTYEAVIANTKTFSAHETSMIQRTLQIMKQKQPADKYEMVYNNTQRLLYTHLNEYQKVQIIGDIVQAIGECEGSGDDFVAFTDILYHHLAPDTSTVRPTATAPRIQQSVDGLYAEPGLPQNTQGPAKIGTEHIYAEPTTLMQQQTMIPLLLANQYSSPVDTNSAITPPTNSNLYSEPVIHDMSAGSSFKPKVATPYAISETIDQPSTSKNLPDILTRMEPGTSGSELSRINRSPTSNRKIPEYTVPSTSHKIPTRVTQETIEDWSDESMENSASSNHSGGSNDTVKIDELVQYDDK